MKNGFKVKTLFHISKDEYGSMSFKNHSLMQSSAIAYRYYNFYYTEFTN